MCLTLLIAAVVTGLSGRGKDMVHASKGRIGQIVDRSDAISRSVANKEVDRECSVERKSVDSQLIYRSSMKIHTSRPHHQ